MSVKPKELLKTGHIVTYRDGSLRRVFCGIDDSTPNVLVGDRVWNSLEHYNDELIYYHHDNRNLDIMKIKVCSNLIDLERSDLHSIQTTTIWERIEPKEMTIAEIEQALGYPIKVVRE